MKTDVFRFDGYKKTTYTYSVKDIFIDRLTFPKLGDPWNKVLNKKKHGELNSFSAGVLVKISYLFLEKMMNKVIDDNVRVDFPIKGYGIQIDESYRVKYPVLRFYVPKSHDSRFYHYHVRLKGRLMERLKIALNDKKKRYL